MLVLSTAGAVAADEVEKKIAEAKRLARKYLIGMQRRDGSWDLMRNQPCYRVGGTALAIWALTAAGEPVESKSVRFGLRYLVERYRRQEKPDFGCVYNAACVLLGVLGYAQARSPHLMNMKDTLSERLRGTWCTLPEEYQRLVRKAARYLADSQRGGWYYKGGYREDTFVAQPWQQRAACRPLDMSNTEWALFALYLAARVGVPVPRKVFEDAAEWIMSVQERRGRRTARFPVPGVDLSVKRLRRMEKDALKKDGGGNALKALAERGPLGGEVRRRRMYARGWGYQGSGVFGGQRARSTGSMTAAAVSCLLACRYHLASSEWYDKSGRRLEEAILDGLAHLSRNFRVGRNPGNRNNAYRVHYLFSLQHACRLALLEKIRGRDWFKEATSYLVRRQRRSGCWDADRQLSSAVNTCFALLFLSEAAHPLFDLRPRRGAAAPEK